MSRDRALSLLRDYRGLPLTMTDVADELGISECGARHVLLDLKRAGLIHARPDPEYVQRSLYYAAEDAA